MQPPAATGLGELLTSGLDLLASVAIIGISTLVVVLILRAALSPGKPNKR